MQNNNAMITAKEKEAYINAIVDFWKEFYQEFIEVYKEVNKIGDKDLFEYSVNTFALQELVKRVFYRQDYFARYHSNMKMSEYKEIGLTMFWIIKFKPFKIENIELDEEFTFDINEEFAINYMFKALRKIAELQGKKYDSSRVDEHLYKELEYSLTFRDISKEALGIIVELMATIVIF